MRRDGLHMRLGEANSPTGNSSVQTSDSEEEAERMNYRKRGQEFVMPVHVTAAKVCLSHII